MPGLPLKLPLRPSIPGVFLLLALLLGTSYALLMAPLSIPDEGGHFYRTWLISDGRCIAAPAIGTPLDHRLLDRQVTWQQLPSSADGVSLLTHVDPAHGRPIGMVAMFYAVNLYSCLPYLPAGIAVRAGRLFTDSPLSLLYLGRLANLLLYLSLTFAALRLLPAFQLPLALLALMPMSLHQAASLSADSFTLGFSFLLSAWILHLATTPGRPFTRRHYLLLGLAAILAGLCKSSAGLLFLLLLIPATRFSRPRTRWPAILGFIILGYGTAAAWQVANHANVEIHSTLKHAMDVYPDANAKAIIQHPATFTDAVVRTSRSMAYEYLEEFVGKLAWLVIRLPGWIPWLYLALLLVTAGAAPLTLPLTGRLLLLAILLFNLLTLFAVVWTTEITRELMTLDFLAGRGYIPGLQGRYLIPFAPLLLLAITGLVRLRPSSLAVPAFAAAILVNIVALHMVWDMFQQHSATFPNRFRLALHLDFRATPGNAARRYDDRVISGRTPGGMFMVSRGFRHPVPHLNSITAMGFRIPSDVLLVDDAELSAIPVGDPLPPPPVSKYEGQLVRRPGDTAEDGKVFLVRDSQKHWITDGHWITANGFKWPDDVKMIPASDLAELPDGDAIR